MKRFHRPRPGCGSEIYFLLPLLAILFSAFCKNSRQTASGSAQPQADSAAVIESACPPRSAQFSIAAVGDLMMAGSALSVIRKRGTDYPFDSTRTLLQQADLAITNLEAPFGVRGSRFNKTFTFLVPPDFAPSLANAGFDVVNIANNHILDYGLGPFFQTLRILDSLGIGFCGAGVNRDSAEAGIILSKNGWKAEFLGFSLTYPEQFWATSRKSGTAFAVEQRIVQRIDSLRSKTDLIVVSFHWGKELHDYPELYQRSFARASIDAGADLVIGHHPHVLQGFELYRGKLIAYSLGNFSFGSKSASCRESALVIAQFDSSGFVQADIVPLSVDYRKVQYQPRPLRGAAKQACIRSLNRISKRLNGGRDILSPSGEILKIRMDVTQSRKEDLQEKKTYP